jgi:hypothetical protein
MPFLFLLALAASAAACGVAPVAANATCCQCAGYDGDAHACHWCPPGGSPPSSVGSCRYFGSPAYRCPGFVALRADCPAPCPPLGPSPSASPSPPPAPPAPPAPSPAPPRPFSKKGVGYFGGNCSDFQSQGLSNISWFYDWGHDQASRLRSGCSQGLSVDGVAYIPMIWGKFALHNTSEMNVTFIRGAEAIFSFNEPDHSGSSYLPPLEGAQRWPQMVALARAFNLTLVAPCVSNYASGAWWLATWHAACRNLTGANCSYDHTCLHTYFEPAQVPELFSSLERMHRDYPAPLWLNEFACPPYKDCGAADNLAFAQAVVPRLEALPYVYRYAWFEARAQGKGGGPAGEALLVTPQGNTTPPFVELTPLGKWYNEYVP